uniref:Uncharacterized protein n=1 Tax=Timema tahoe TaxID=61484 RepID=A0A7R9I9P0_9NEOP|nr:unnamed protein product [Timema tahoe]
MNIEEIENKSQLHMAGKSVLELRELLRYRKKERGSVTLIANRLGQPNLITPEWLILTPKDMMPLPEHVSFPKPPKAPDGTLLYERVPNKPEAEKAALNNISPTLLKRRAYEEKKVKERLSWQMYKNEVAQWLNNLIVKEIDKTKEKGKINY